MFGSCLGEILVKMANKSAKMATKIAKLRPHRRICENPRGFEGSRTGENPGAESLEALLARGGSRGKTYNIGGSEDRNNGGFKTGDLRIRRSNH